MPQLHALTSSELLSDIKKRLPELKEDHTNLIKQMRYKSNAVNKEQLN